MKRFYKLGPALMAIAMVCMQHIALAQAKIGTVKGTVVDTAGKRPLASASINILDAKDSSLITFARTKEAGSFEITRLDAGNYLLLVSYTGFGKLQMPFAITAAKPLQDFGSLVVTSTATLADVVVTAAPIVVRGDTIEYNAASFKVNKPNAVVEDLLKKAESQSKAGKYDEALVEVGKALELDPANAKAKSLRDTIQKDKLANQGKAAESTVKQRLNQGDLRNVR
jgi:uncharacterized surface anchored protein